MKRRKESSLTFPHLPGGDLFCTPLLAVEPHSPLIFWRKKGRTGTIFDQCSKNCQKSRKKGVQLVPVAIVQVRSSDEWVK